MEIFDLEIIENLQILMVMVTFERLFLFHVLGFFMVTKVI